MWEFLGFISHIVDWRFAVGLLVGAALTMRYVLRIIRPLIEDLKRTQD